MSDLMRDQVTFPCLAWQVGDALGTAGMALRFRYVYEEGKPAADTPFLVLTMEQAIDLHHDIGALLQRRGISTG